MRLSGRNVYQVLKAVSVSHVVSSSQAMKQTTWDTDTISTQADKTGQVTRTHARMLTTLELASKVAYTSIILGRQSGEHFGKN